MNFMGKNWLVIVDAYSKYSCIYPSCSVSMTATMVLPENLFVHIGYPHSSVTDTAATLMSSVFQE